MAAEKATYPFNFDSRAYKSQLKPAARDTFDFLLKNGTIELQNHQADYERHKPQRIAQKEEQLTKHYKLKLEGPPPPSTVSRPRMPTAEEIRAEARRFVKTDYERGQQEIKDRYNSAITEHLRKELNLRQDVSQTRYDWLGRQGQGHDHGGHKR
jgi:hypothetical protein